MFSWPIYCLPHSVCLVYSLSMIPILVDKGPSCLIHFRRPRHIMLSRLSNPNSIFAKVNGQACKKKLCKGKCFKWSPLHFQTRHNIWRLYLGCIRMTFESNNLAWLNRWRDRLCYIQPETKPTFSVLTVKRLFGTKNTYNEESYSCKQQNKDAARESCIPWPSVEGHMAEVHVDNGMGKCLHFYWGESETSDALMILWVK